MAEHLSSLSHRCHTMSQCHFHCGSSESLAALGVYNANADYTFEA